MSTTQATVKSNLFLISGFLKALMIELIISDHLCFSTKCFDLLLSAIAVSVDLNIKLLG